MRKHHNKLYYSKYRYKTIFKLPGSLQFYPTTDQYLQELINDNIDKPDMIELAGFILTHRTSMKFRMQDKTQIFYSDKKLAHELIEKFWDYWYGSESVDPKFKQLGKNTVGCRSFPHGKFQYQVHLKKDAHQYLTNNERESLWAYLERNEHDCLVTNKYVLDYLIGKYPHCYNGYFYISEEKMLTPIYMIAQKGIDKVTKFVKAKNERNKKITRS
jgi:hypothetical protein